MTLYDAIKHPERISERNVDSVLELLSRNQQMFRSLTNRQLATLHNRLAFLLDDVSRVFCEWKRSVLISSMEFLIYCYISDITTSAI